LSLLDLRERFSRLLTLRPGRRYSTAMDRRVNSAPRTGIQFARKKQILIFITGGIVLTQADVRKIQLAVAAIKSGVRMMLDEAGLGVCNLDGIFVAGANVIGGRCGTDPGYIRKMAEFLLK